MNQLLSNATLHEDTAPSAGKTSMDWENLIKCHIEHKFNTKATMIADGKARNLPESSLITGTVFKTCLRKFGLIFIIMGLLHHVTGWADDRVRMNHTHTRE